MPSFIYSPLAEQDLAEIWTYIQPHNEDAADRMLRLIDKTCELISEYPKIGRDRDNIIQGMFSFPVGNYLIFYRAALDGVEIARIVDGRRDVPEIFRDATS